MPLKYRFYIRPEEDACHRCLDETFSGAPFGSPYKIHEIYEREEELHVDPITKELVFVERGGEGRTGIFHKMCRCHAYVLEIMDEETEIPIFQATKVAGARGLDREVRQTYKTIPSQLRKNAGKDFWTIVSETITNLFNKIFGLMPWQSAEEEDDNGPTS